MKIIRQFAGSPNTSWEEQTDSPAMRFWELPGTHVSHWILSKTQIKKEAFGTVKRNPMAKGAMLRDFGGKVVFQASETTARVPVDATILDAADEAGSKSMRERC